MHHTQHTHIRIHAFPHTFISFKLHHSFPEVIFRLPGFYAIMNSQNFFPNNSSYPQWAFYNRELATFK